VHELKQSSGGSPAWANVIETGQAAMDAEHRVELALLDALEEAVRQDRGPNRIHEILDQLIEHTNVHFISEQLLMRLTAYPRYEAHAEEHEQLMEQASELQEHVEAGRVQPTLAFIESMRRWLVQHMEGQDRTFATFLDGHRGTTQ